LGETENVIDEQEHILTLHVAEIFRHRKPGQADPETRAWWFVHLAIDQPARPDHPAFLHLQVEIVTLTGPLTHTTKNRSAAVTLGDVVDQLHDDDGLPYPGAAE
jgi:hypothetical protein